MNQNDFLDIVSCVFDAERSKVVSLPPQIQKPSYKNQVKTKILLFFHGKPGVTLVCLVYGSIGFVKWVIGTGSNSVVHWTWSEWWIPMVRSGYSIIFLVQDATGNNTEIHYSTQDKFIGALATISFLHSRLFGAYCDLFLLIGVLTLWSKTEMFTFSILLKNRKNIDIFQIKKSARRSSNNPWPEIYEEYKSLRQLSDLINTVFGSNALIFLIEVILDYGISMDGAFVDKKRTDWFQKFTLGFYFFLTFPAVLGFSGDICHKASENIFVKKTN